MRLLTTLQSVRLCALAASGRKMSGTNKSRKKRSMDFSLLVTQCLNRIEASRAGSRVQPGNQADDEGKNDGRTHQPPRYRPETLGRKGLALQVNICPQVDDVADAPAQRDSHHSAQQSHPSGL